MLTLTELADGVKVQDIVTSVGCEFKVSPNIKKMGDVTKPEELIA